MEAVFGSRSVRHSCPLSLFSEWSKSKYEKAKKRRPSIGSMVMWSMRVKMKVASFTSPAVVMSSSRPPRLISPNTLPLPKPLM